MPGQHSCYSQGKVGPASDPTNSYILPRIEKIGLVYESIELSYSHPPNLTPVILLWSIVSLLQ